MVKNLPAKVGDAGDLGLIPGSGRSSGGGNGNPLQYFCLENPMDTGAWWATVHGVAKSWTRLKQLSTHAHKENTKPLNLSFQYRAQLPVSKAKHPLPSPFLSLLRIEAQF